MSDANNKKKESIGEEILKELERELGLETSDLLNQEIDLIKKISSLSGSIEGKLKKLYSSKFPKRCNNCQRIYESRAQYLKETNVVKGSNQNSILGRTGVQEYRDCVCGSTLVLITEDRRDTTEFGEARRKLFDMCVDKLQQVTGSDRAIIVEKIRVLFREVIQKAQTEPEKYFDDEKEKKK